MRRYKAVVIDFKKIMQRGCLFLLTAVSSFFAIRAAWHSGINILPEQILKNNISILETDRTNPFDKTRNFIRKASETVLGFIPSDDFSLIKSVVPIYAALSDSVLIDTASSTALVITENIEDEPMQTISESIDISPENRAPIKSIDAAQKTSQSSPIAIANETTYGINIWDMLSAKPDIDMGGGDVKILITHTHATESYAPKEANIYDVTASDRSDDKSKNVVSVGRKMKEIFEKNGIKTLHDEILHDAPSFNGSYAHSLSSVEKYISENPSLQIVFDIHRDSIVYDDKTKAKTVTKINGRNAAQLMFVVGTDYSGLYNPNWRYNMQAALHFQKAVSDKYPKLMRHVNLRRERFNGHTSNASMIIEVGTSGNSLDEALYSIELAAECIANYLKNL